MDPEEVDWDYVVNAFKGTRSRHQVLIKAVYLGEKCECAIHFRTPGSVSSHLPLPIWSTFFVLCFSFCILSVRSKGKTEGLFSEPGLDSV